MLPLISEAKLRRNETETLLRIRDFRKFFPECFAAVTAIIKYEFT
jgi:hypothetical protein